MQQPRFVLWRAVSTEDQVERESLAHQDKLNREHVARWNGVIVASLEVPGISRSIVLWEDACQSIPAYTELDALIKRRAFDVLMCMDVTRLGRDRALIVTAAALCERAGIRIYETSSPPASIEGPHSTSDTRLLMMLKGHISEEEVRKFSERAMFGRAAQIRKGKHANNPPAGFRQIHSTETGEVVTIHDEPWIPLITLFYELYLDHGRSQVAIAREFNARGLLMPTTGRAWDEDSIRVFLRNRWAYAGFVTWAASSKKLKSFRAKAEWEPIISAEIAQRAEDEMLGRSHMPRTLGATERFSTIGKCATCNSTLVVTRAKRRTPGTGERIYYRCKPQCVGGLIRDLRIHEAIREAIVSLQDDANLESVLDEVPTKHPDLEEILEESRRALAQVSKERNNLTTAFMREAIRLDEYEMLMQELRVRYEGVSARIDEISAQLATTPTKAQRREHLEEIRNAGLAMLDHPDTITANAWLRKRFRVYVANNKVQAVELL